MHRSTKNCIWLKCRNDGVSVSAGDSAVRWPVAVAVVGGRGCVGRCSLLLRCPMCLVPSRLQLRRAGGPPEAAHRIFACVSLRLLVLRKLWHLVIRHVQQAADPSQELLSKHVCLLRLRIAPRWISGRSRNCAPVCSSPLPLAVAGWQVAALLVLIYAYK